MTVGSATVAVSLHDAHRDGVGVTPRPESSAAALPGERTVGHDLGAADEHVRDADRLRVEPLAAAAWLCTAPEARELNGQWIEGQELTARLGLLPGWDSPGSVSVPAGDGLDA